MKGNFFWCAVCAVTILLVSVSPVLPLSASEADNDYFYFEELTNINGLDLRQLVNGDAAANCTRHGGDCGGCLNEPAGCGFCYNPISQTGSCFLLGGNDGSDNTTVCEIPSKQINESSSCPNPHFDNCTLYDSCDSCSADPGCVFCYDVNDPTNGTCTAGGVDGPTNDGTCPEEYDYAHTSDQCPGEFSCSDYDGDCFACAARPECGYCQAGNGTCVAGDASGPFSPATCPADEYAFDPAECDSAVTPCESYTSCKQCVRDPFCGYCVATGQCFNGDDSGPTLPGDVCPPYDDSEDSSWVFDPSSPAICPEPPVFVFAAVTPSAATIVVSFDVPTDRAGFRGVFACSELVENTNLGLDATCYWQDDIHLVIRFGIGATIEVGENITIRTGMLRNKVVAETARQEGETQDDTLLLQGPLLHPEEVFGPAIPPTPTIEAPRFIADCNVLVLDGGESYGAGGRPWEEGYIWRAEAPDGSTDVVEELNALLQTQTGPRVVIPPGMLLANREYILSLTLTNWLEESNTHEVTLSVLVRDQVQVQIQGPKSFVTHRNNPISFRTVVTPPCVCENSSEVANICDPEGVYSYAWVRSVGPIIQLDRVTRLSDTVYIPPGTFIGGETYELTASSTINDNVNYVGRDFVTVTIASSPLIARIDTLSRTLSRLSSIVLDASASYDPEGRTGELSFQWFCERADDLFPGEDCPANRYFARPEFQQATITLPAGAVLPGKYSFSVHVSKGTRSAEASELVTVNWEDMPTVSIRIGDDPLTRDLRINPGSQLVLRGSAFSPTGQALVSYQWAQLVGDLDLSDPDTLGGLLTDESLVINAAQMTPGADYHFRLSVTDESGETGRADVAFRTNDAPWSGECTMEPDSGVAFETEFDLRCIGFEDNAEDFPLFYTFYIRTASGLEFPLATHYPNTNKLRTLLPALGEPITVLVRVRDRLGAVAYGADGERAIIIRENVIITEPASLEELRSSNMVLRDHISDANDTINSELFQDALRLGDVRLLSSLLFSILLDLNAEGAADPDNYNPFLLQDEVDLRGDLYNYVADLPLENSNIAGEVFSVLLSLLSGEVHTGGDRRREASSLALRQGLAETPEYAIEILKLTIDLLELGTLGGSAQETMVLLGDILFYNYPILQNLSPENEHLGQEFAELLLEAVDLLTIYQASLLPPGAFPVTLDSRTIAARVTRNFIDRLPTTFSLGEVLVEVPTDYLQNYFIYDEVEEVDTALYLFALNPYVFSQASETVVPTYKFVLREAGRDLNYRRFDTPIIYQSPISTDNTDKTADEIFDLYGLHCLLFERADLQWAISPSCEDVSTDPNFARCACTEIYSTMQTAQVRPVQTVEAPGPLDPVHGSDREGIEEDNPTLWVLLSLVLVFAALLLIAGVVFITRRRRDTDDQEEDDSKLTGEKAALMKTMADDKAAATTIRSPRRELDLPPDYDSEESERLLRPTIENGVIVYEKGTEEDYSRSSSKSPSRSSSSKSTSSRSSRGASSRSMSSQSASAPVAAAAATTTAAKASNKLSSRSHSSRDDEEYSSDDEKQKEKQKEKEPVKKEEAAKEVMPVVASTAAPIKVKDDDDHSSERSASSKSGSERSRSGSSSKSGSEKSESSAAADKKSEASAASDRSTKSDKKSDSKASSESSDHSASDSDHSESDSKSEDKAPSPTRPASPPPAAVPVAAVAPAEDPKSESHHSASDASDSESEHSASERSHSSKSGSRTGSRSGSASGSASDSGSGSDSETGSGSRSGSRSGSGSGSGSSSGSGSGSSSERSESDSEDSGSD
ncbi:Counting factor 45-1 [Balamuthia mandrillaris]